jgi:hypothetical protein
MPASVVIVEMFSEFALCRAWKSPIVRGIDGCDCNAKLLARCGGCLVMPINEFDPAPNACDDANVFEVSPWWLCRV